MSKQLTALIIMDGFGINPNPTGNAITQAGTPGLDKLMAHFPHTRIEASGPDVGLPPQQMGNSEVGHLNIGAGRIVNQELMQITRDIESGVFFQKEPLLWAMQSCKQKDSSLHLMGLLSDGGVHSHNTHLYALLQMAKDQGLKKVYVHCFLDGRDVPPTSGASFVAALQEKIKEIGVGKIASIQGRYWGMDRDKIWERVKIGYNAIALGQGIRASDPVKAVEESCQNGKWDETLSPDQLIAKARLSGTDEFMLPAVIAADGEAPAQVHPGDSIISFNFRPDRARQITSTFIKEDFKGFERLNGFIPVQFVSMTQYDETFTGLQVVNPPHVLSNTLGEYLSKLGLKQLRIAETQKYAHVTFFFNGGVEKANPGEERVLIASSKVATFDMKPEMSALTVCDKALEIVDSGLYDVMILNFANCDMVGHTGIMPAAVQAVKTVDACVSLLVARILDKGGRAFVTADHGNADQMIDYETGEPFTAHTTNPVPFIACDEALLGKPLRTGGRLADIAPTMLKSMGIAIPEEMDGKPLF